MKRILLFIFLIIGIVSARAQNLPYIIHTPTQYDEIVAARLGIANDTFAVRSAYGLRNRAWIAAIDDVIYIWSISQQKWVAISGGGGGGSVTSVFGRTGSVTAQSGDYSAFYVPLSRTINGYALSSNLSLTKADIGLSAVPNVDATLRSNHTGTQLASTISDFTTAGRNLFTAGTGISYNNSTGVISATGITSVPWGGLTGSLSDQADLVTALAAKENSANKANTFTTVNSTLFPTIQAVVDYATGLTISGVALGGNLADLNATNTTITFSGNYNGSTPRTIGLNLGNANTWTARQTFNNGITVGDAAVTSQFGGFFSYGPTSTTSTFTNLTAQNVRMHREFGVNGSSAVLIPANQSLVSNIFHGEPYAPTLAATGTHDLIAQVGIKLGNITGNGSTNVTNAAALYIDGPMSLTGGTGTITNNYSLWVRQGNTRLGGGLQVDGLTSATTSNVVYYNTTSKQFTYGAASSGSGTVNSGTANRLSYYSTSTNAVSELSAITANKALVSNGSGLPIASTTTDTELAFVSGVTSAIQTQFTGKEATFTETAQEFTSSTSMSITLSNTPKTGKAEMYYLNGIVIKQSNISRTGTGVTLSGFTRESSDVITAKYSY